MPKPFFTLNADGVDVTAQLQDAGISMTITDAEGYHADTLRLVIDDVDGSVVSPRTGAVLNPHGGYSDSGEIRDFGFFVVDGVTYTGWPQQITVDAKSVDAMSPLKQRERRAFTRKDYPTFGDILTEVASGFGLALQMPNALRSIETSYEAQTEETGLEFLTRICRKLDASVTVKAGNLIVVEKGMGMSASGLALDVIAVASGLNLISYSVNERNEPKHSEVEATYYDRARNQVVPVTESTGLDGPVFRMREAFENEVIARGAAKGMARELSRMQGEATFEIEGAPFAQAEAFALVSGCRPNVDGRWRIKTVTHNFSATGIYTTTLESETPST